MSEPSAVRGLKEVLAIEGQTPCVCVLDNYCNYNCEKTRGHTVLENIGQISIISRSRIF